MTGPGAPSERERIAAAYGALRLAVEDDPVTALVALGNPPDVLSLLAVAAELADLLAEARDVEPADLIADLLAAHIERPEEGGHT